MEVFRNLKWFSMLLLRGKAQEGQMIICLAKQLEPSLENKEGSVKDVKTRVTTSESPSRKIWLQLR